VIAFSKPVDELISRTGVGPDLGARHPLSDALWGQGRIRASVDIVAMVL
jgi:hypothetical protein